LLNGKSLITNKVTTIFSVTPFKVSFYTLHALPTEDSRINSLLAYFGIRLIRESGSSMPFFPKGSITIRLRLSKLRVVAAANRSILMVLDREQMFGYDTSYLLDD